MKYTEQIKRILFYWHNVVLNTVWKYMSKICSEILSCVASHQQIFLLRDKKDDYTIKCIV
jgi:hypothetical protein